MGSHDTVEVLLAGVVAAVIILGIEYLLKCRRCRRKAKG